VPKFRRATPPNSEVISANLLHFKPIFFVQRRNDRCRQRRLDYVVIFIVSRDIFGQTRKLS